MKYFKITALYYGQMTLSVAAFGHPEAEKTLDIPILGFLLRNGEQNILVDSGMKAEYFEQMAIGDVNPIGSRELFLKALADEGLTPEDIDTVIYTHLHYDHVGNMELMPNAVTYIQKKEYENLLHPTAFQIQRMDYFSDTIEQLKKLNNVLFIDGDIKLANGIELFVTPGHSPGGQSIAVPTEKGTYVLCGDIPSTRYALFPKTDKVVLMDGGTLELTPVTDLPFLEGQFNNNWFAAYDSHYKQLAKAEKPIPEFLLPSHEPENIFIKYFG